MTTLNLGCGNGKITDAINIDINPRNNPDLLHDIRQPLPFNDNSMEKVLILHTIEHIQKKYHKQIIKESWRVLEPYGMLIITYPDFVKCTHNWLENKQGIKEFWEHTIFGRQLHEADFHVCIMDSEELEELLVSEGFLKVRTIPEEHEDYNSVTFGRKGDLLITYEDVVVEDTKTLVVGL